MANKDKIKKEEEARSLAESKIQESLKKSKFKEKKYLTFLIEKIIDESSRRDSKSYITDLYKSGMT